MTQWFIELELSSICKVHVKLHNKIKILQLQIQCFRRHPRKTLFLQTAVTSNAFVDDENHESAVLTLLQSFIKLTYTFHTISGLNNFLCL